MHGTRIFRRTRAYRMLLTGGSLALCLVALVAGWDFWQEGELHRLLYGSLILLTGGVFGFASAFRFRITITEEYIERVEIRTRRIRFDTVTALDLRDHMAGVHAGSVRLWIHTDVANWREAVREVVRHVDLTRVKVEGSDAVKQFFGIPLSPPPE